MKQNIYVKKNFGRFANQFWQWAIVLSYCHRYDVDVDNFYSNEKYFKDGTASSMKTILNYNNIFPIFYSSSSISNKQTFDNYNTIPKNENIEFKGYLQDYSSIRESYIQGRIKFPPDIIDKIKQDFPNINNSVVLHVRRGDYLKNGNDTLYNILTPEYIKNVYNKYFKGMPVIVISDDIDYCKTNLKKICKNIQFSEGDELYDFILLTMSCGNICSSSSFSILGSILNQNIFKKIIVPSPYYLENKIEENLIPPYAIREELKK